MGEMLADSAYCRLCANESECGFTIFDHTEEKASLAILINKYLPIKVVNDGILPVRICEQCHVGVAATVDLIDRMVEGQLRLRSLLQPAKPEKPPDPSVASVLVNIQGESADIPMDDLAKGSEVSKVFAENHAMRLAVGGVKKKRGRPKRTERAKIKEECQLEPDDNGPRRSSRRSSLPSRYRDTFALNDFEKIMIDSGCKEEPEMPMDDFRDPTYKRGIKEEVMTGEDVTSIVIAPDIQDNPSDLPFSVNIEVNFEEDGNITLRGMEELEENRTKNEPISSIQITTVGDPVPLKTELKEPTQSTQPQKKRGPRPKMTTTIGDEVNVRPKDSFSEPSLFRKRRGAKKKPKWVCSLCGKGFLHKGRYVLHNRLHKQVILQCDTCKDRFSTQEDLNIHQQNTKHCGLGIIEVEKEGENVEFKCPHCPSRTFVSQEGYENHVSSMHEGAKPFACGTCGKRFAYQHSLRNHYALHEPVKEEREYPCGECGKVFMHPSSLIYHRDSTHNNGRMFVCHICNASFKHKQLLQRHYSVHSEDRPYICEICSTAFKTRGNLYNHMNTHTGQRKFTCEICGKQFNHLTSLTLHVRSHTGEKPFKCEHCGKRFTQNGNLQEHIRIHTGEKPFCCETCGKKFTTSSQFKLHMRRHTGERPFTCSYCSKPFLNRDACRTHERKHTGEKPFVCTVCGKGFSESYVLKKHLRMHTGEKPYTCGTCGKAFRDASNLSKHRRSHRDDETWLTLPEPTLPEQELPEPATLESSDHRIIYILSDKDDPDAATLTALQAVDNEITESPALENMTEGTAQMIQLNPESHQALQGFTLSSYNQSQTAANAAATTVMLQEGAAQDHDRQIQIFTNDGSHSVIPVIDSSGETIGEMQGHFLTGANGGNNSGVGSLTSGGNNTLEITLKDGQPLSLVIPEGEDPTLYVQRAIETAVLSHQNNSSVSTHHHIHKLATILKTRPSIYRTVFCGVLMSLLVSRNIKTPQKTVR